MKHKLVLLVTFLSLGIYAQDSDPFAPIMKFKNDTLNVGTIKKGAEGNFEFIFTNTGRIGLEIEAVTSECACIVTEYPKKTVKRGHKGVIKVAYYTHRVGPINKTITIKSNVSGGIKTIYLVGNVES